MKVKRPLAPAFINQLDEYLLLHKPDTWSARAHLVVYYGLLFIAVLAGICFIAPNDPRAETIIYLWCVFTGILSLVAFIVWLIYLLRFNVFKRFGIVTAGDRVKTFLLYFLSIGMMVLAVYVPPYVESVRANKAYGLDEIVSDMDDMNLGICSLAYDSLPHYWHQEHFLVRNNDSYLNVLIPSQDETDPDGQVVNTRGGNRSYVIDSGSLRSKLALADSVRKINDSVYTIYTCPDYKFVDAYQSIFTTKSLTNKDLYEKVIRHYVRPDKAKTTAALITLVKKYVPDYEERLKDDRNSYSGYYDRIKETYFVNSVNRNMDHILDRKYRWQGRNLNAFIHVFFYVTTILSLLVFIFRHSTVKTFFLTLLSAVLILIITSLFGAFLDINDINVFVICIIYYCLFFLLSLMAIKSRVRNIVAGIGLNLTVALTAWLPVTIVALYYGLLRYRHRNDNIIPIDHDRESMHYLYAEIIGVVLLLVLIETLFKFLYRKWYASPEQ
jgi:uncharacterized membrane protein